MIFPRSVYDLNPLFYRHMAREQGRNLNPLLQICWYPTFSKETNQYSGYDSIFRTNGRFVEILNGRGELHIILKFRHLEIREYSVMTPFLRLYLFLYMITASGFFRKKNFFLFILKPMKFFKSEKPVFGKKFWNIGNPLKVQIY